MPVSSQLDSPLYWSATIPMENPWSKATLLKWFVVLWQTKSSVLSLSCCSCSVPAIWNAFIAFLDNETLSQSWWLQSAGAACKELERRKQWPGCRRSAGIAQSLPAMILREFARYSSIPGGLHRKCNIQEIMIVKFLVFVLPLSLTVVPRGGCRQSDLQQPREFPNEYNNFSTSGFFYTK